MNFGNETPIAPVSSFTPFPNHHDLAPSHHDTAPSDHNFFGDDDTFAAFDDPSSDESSPFPQHDITFSTTTTSTAAVPDAPLIEKKRPRSTHGKKKPLTPFEQLALTAAQIRKEKIARFVAKRPLRKYDRRGETRYEVRKDFATHRKRVSGRFVPKSAPRVEVQIVRRPDFTSEALINWDRETSLAIKSQDKQI